MNSYSLRSSLEERARKQNPSLDISVSRKVGGTPRLQATRLDVVLPRNIKQPAGRGLDGVRSDQFSRVPKKAESTVRDMAGRSFERIGVYVKQVRSLFGHVLPTFAPHKMLYGAIVGGIAFGMVSMAFIEHAFGPGVFARSEMIETSVRGSSSEVSPAAVVAVSPSEEYVPDQDVFFEYFGQVTKERYEESIRDMVKGYPIEAMLPFIFEQDRLTAAFLVGIAKKESNWGKRIPVLDGQDCYNYWGYRGVRRMMGSGGHTCFNSRKDAVETVAGRLNKLIRSEKLDTPEKMIVWKCGFSCQGHSRESVKKWIADVDMYFSQLNDE